MADRFFSVIKGEQLVSQVTEGGSTSSEALELRINDTLYADKQIVLNGLEAIKAYIISRETQPIA